MRKKAKVYQWKITNIGAFVIKSCVIEKVITNKHLLEMSINQTTEEL